MCLQVLRVAAIYPLQLAGLERHRHFGDDLGGDFILDGEDIVQVTVVAFSPYVIAVRAIDQLRVDPNPPSRPSDAAFEDMSNTEVAGNVPHIHRLALVCEG